MIVADELLAHSQGKALIADTGYDSNRFRQAVRDKGMKPVIGSKPERPRKLPKSRELYGKRYLVECFFHNLKRFRAIATRFEKTASNFLALTQLACAGFGRERSRDTPSPSRTRRGDPLASIADRTPHLHRAGFPGQATPKSGHGHPPGAVGVRFRGI
jgi:transposase